MRNSNRTRMITWIIAAIILLCAVPMISMAEDVIEPLDFEDAFVLNQYANCHEIYKNADGNAFTELSNADRGKQYTLKLTVSESTEGMLSSFNGEMIYNLPEADKYGEIASIESANVRGVQSGTTIVFNWTNGMQSSFTADIKFKATNVYDLYNIAKIGNDYYRLSKTTISTEKTLGEYLKGITAVGNQKVLNASEYTAEDYNFADLAIIKDGVEYVYRPNDFVSDKNNPVQYYTVKFDRVAAVYKKIGGMNGSTPRWAVSEEQRYEDNNATDSFHRDYIITLHKMEVKKDLTAVQDLYNMLSVNGDSNFYRLKKTQIKALPASNYANDRIMKPSEYERIPDTDYDFTNLVLTIDGVDYQYSPVEMTGEHPAYYTVYLDKVKTRNTINRNQSWFDNEAGWLDGAKETYDVIDNNIVGYHADYNATLYKSTIVTPDLTVTIESNVSNQEKVYSGTEIVLTAVRGGSYTGNVTTIWERIDPDTGERTLIPEATDMNQYSYIIDADNARYTYSVTLTPKE